MQHMLVTGNIHCHFSSLSFQTHGRFTFFYFPKFENGYRLTLTNRIGGEVVWHPWVEMFNCLVETLRYLLWQWLWKMNWVESLSACVLEQGMLKQSPNHSVFKKHMLLARNKLPLFENIEVWQWWGRFPCAGYQCSPQLLRLGLFSPCLSQVRQHTHTQQVILNRFITCRWAVGDNK